MRKVLLLIILFAVIGGVVYLKSVRQTKAESDAYFRGKVDVARLADNDRHRADSLAKVNASLESALATSRRVSDSLNVLGSDSLMEVIGQQSDSIDQLTDDINNKPHAKRLAAAAKIVDENRRLVHAEIVKYYTNRYDSLPADLSAYEKRVALTEIRQETVLKFSITEEELEFIREQANLDF